MQPKKNKLELMNVEAHLKGFHQGTDKVRFKNVNYCTVLQTIFQSRGAAIHLRNLWKVLHKP